jgi:hypothetical protein
MNVRTRSLLIATITGVLALPSVLVAEEAKTEDKQNNYVCWGINKCKGQGSCSATGRREDGCSGSNSCRRQGFLRIEPETCLKIEGGSLTKKVAKSKTPAGGEKKSS